MILGMPIYNNYQQYQNTKSASDTINNYKTINTIVYSISMFMVKFEVINTMCAYDVEYKVWIGIEIEECKEKERKLCKVLEHKRIQG